MDRLKRDAKKEPGAVSSSRHPKRDRRWTLLFIGDHGKVLTLKRFKGIVVLATLVLCVSVAITVCLYLINQNIIVEKKQLETELEGLKKQSQNLQHEKDILLARLVIAESRMQKSVGGRSENAREANTEKPTVETPTTEDSSVIAAVKKVGVPAHKQSKPVIDQPQPELSVAVENLQISRLKQGNRMSLQFKIKNTTPNSQHVSGRAIVVLKGSQLPKNRWVSIPQVPLTGGKPTGTRRGHAFGINYFKMMRFTSAIPTSPKKFETASVYVFTRDGKLLLERDFPITLPSSQLTSSTPSPSSTSSSSSTPSSSPSPSSTSSSSSTPSSASTASPSPTASSSSIAPTMDSVMEVLKNTPTDE
ncbi:MAG: hypothetical protein PVF53_01925 [Desulfobacterales bacterium]|jgi:hypothetical protein